MSDEKKTKAVVIRVDMPLVVRVPLDWDAEDVDFFYHESSHCKNNLFRDIARTAKHMDKEGHCMCFVDEVEVGYLREATVEDLHFWGDGTHSADSGR
jgi:hypothetical protein